MKRWTGNIMTLDYFADFYYLEAISANMVMAASANPDLAWKHSYQRLEADVKDAFAHLTHEMAFRIYVYLYAASLGEARHAQDKKINIQETKNKSRETVYHLALDYFPSDNNVKLLKSVFRDNTWNSAFGGKAWLNIVEAMDMYGKVSDAAFIDHSVDLEHNGGCVFSKSANFGLYCFGESMNLRKFLDFKFSHNILETVAKNNYIRVSWKVYNLLNRYMNVCTKAGSAAYIKTLIAINSLTPDLEWLNGYSVEWGTNEFNVKPTEKKENHKYTQHSGSHIRRVEVGHTYYVKYDGRSHACGFMRGKMVNRGTIEIDHKNFNGFGYCNGWWYAKEWLYEVEEKKVELTNVEQFVIVKEDANTIPASVSFVPLMHKYLGKTIKVKKVPGYEYLYYDAEHGWNYHKDWLIFETRTERRERRELPICYSCGHRIKNGDRFSYNGDDYCSDCYNDMFNTCYSCGDVYPTDSLCYNEDTGCDYCESCWNHRFTYCEKCGKDMQRKDSVDCTYHPTYFHMCEDCANKVMFFCDECENWKMKDEQYITRDGYDVCSDCINECTVVNRKIYFHKENAPQERKGE